ncbi:HPr family phosphocarrier protein [Fodinisporobacter ferrooxydans]|uniref:HPr family phosphocarrier protein n=1 Tax=Fodinisporobacter ferrooxydans TaxID=2901836 RepID=A0ABY4CDW2_9BACL|nr:HPr family phosphocarrier protein [Alicyclobacillaceae bacterium MYW30-H2]
MIFSKLQVQVKKQFDVYTVDQLVRIASRFQSDIHLEYNGKQVDAKSIMGIFTLLIAVGSTVVISAMGNDYQQALEAISAYITQPPNA